MNRHAPDIAPELVDLFEASDRPAPTPELPDHSFAAILFRMTPAERISASRHGGFTRRERSIWAAQFPNEVPLINGEFEWIARTLE
jgi:hypothetical protein